MVVYQCIMGEMNCNALYLDGSDLSNAQVTFPLTSSSPLQCAGNLPSNLPVDYLSCTGQVCCTGPPMQLPENRRSDTTALHDSLRH